MSKLTGKVGIVTGAAAGIGRAIATLFAEEGCTVIVSDINVVGGEETVAAITSNGGVATFFRADVANEADVKQLVDSTIESYGRLDLAVNNAGIEPAFAPLHELSLADWDDCMRVNLTGVFLCTKHELAYMRDHGGGAIVNISSVAAAKSIPNLHVYSAAKRGVLALTSCTAVEGGAHGVRANAILPGAIETQMLLNSPGVAEEFVKTIPLGAIGQPDQVARAALWLCSDDACYVTGQYLGVCGGVTA